MLPVLAVLIASVIYVMVQVRGVFAHLDVLLVEEVKRQTHGRAVEVGRVEASSLGYAVVHDLKIANGKSFNSGYFLDVDKIIVRYKWSDLIFGRVKPVQSVASVKLIGPKIFLERYKSGRLNIQDMITPRPGPPRPPFIGLVEITGGAFELRDWRAMTPGAKPAVTRIENLAGMFDASGAPEYIYNLSARGVDDKLLGQFTLSGSINNKTGLLSLDIQAKNAAARYWSSYFSRLPVVTVLSGRADVSLSATRHKDKRGQSWQYIGSAKLRNSSVKVTGIRGTVVDVNGRVDLARGRLGFDVSGRAAGSPITLTGTVAGLKSSALDLHIKSNQADFSRLVQAMQTRFSLGATKVSGKGPLDVSITGSSRNPVVSIRAKIPSAALKGYLASDIDLNAVYKQSVLELESIKARMLGGSVAAEGTISLADDGTKLALSGEASNVQMERLPAMAQANLKGSAAGRFALTGTFNSPALEADVKVSRGSLYNLAYSNASGRITITKENVRLENTAAAVSDGVVRLSGDISSKGINLRASAVGVDVAKLERPFGLTNYGGIVNFDGSLEGTFAAPTVKGSVEVFNGRYDEYEFDYARSHFTATPTSVELKDAIVRLPPAEITLQGRIDDIQSTAPMFDLGIDIADAQADRILSLLHLQGDVVGTVAGSAVVRGRIPNVSANGTLTLTDGYVGGYPVSDAKAVFSYADKEFSLSELTAHSDDAILTASGTLDGNNTPAFDFAVKDVSLTRLSRYVAPYAVFSGSIDVTGRVGGTMKQPVITAGVTSSGLTINTVKFDDLSAGLSWGNSVFTVSDLALSLAENQLSIPRISYDSANETLNVESASLTDFSYPSLYTLVVESPYIEQPGAGDLRAIIGRLSRPNTGTLTMNLSAAGKLKYLEVKLGLSAKGIDIGEIKNVQLDLATTSRKGQIMLDSFLVDSDVISFSANGTLLSEGQTNLEVDAYNVNLTALTPANAPAHLTGTATARASIHGAIRSPDIEASVEMIEPTIYGISFDRLRASQITVGQNSIDISRVLLTKDDHSVSLYGMLPWNWTNFSVPPDKPIELHAVLERQTLGLLGVLTSVVTPDSVQPGAISANLDITGTVANPNMTGQFIVADGNFAIKNLENTFTNVQADFSFEQDIVRVNRLTGMSSEGGDFEVVPGGIVMLRNVLHPAANEPVGDINLAVRLNNLVINESNLFGYQENVRGMLITDEAGISLTGSLMEPTIAGNVAITDASAALARNPVRPAPRAWAFGFNPRLDLNFSVLNDVWFRSQSLTALMHGDGHLSGSLAKPQVNAELQITRGTISLPTASMRITSGTVTVDWSPSGEGARVAVAIRAQTSINAASPSGTQRRYNIIMDVHGPLDNLQPENVDLRSDPPGLSRTQILAALGHLEEFAGGGELALRTQLRDIFTAAVSPLFLNPLETGFMEALGLEEFSIEYGFEQPLAVFISRKLFDGFHISYWQIVTGEPNSLTGATYSFTLGYRLRDWLEIGYVSDSSRVTVLQVSYNRRF